MEILLGLARVDGRLYFEWLNFIAPSPPFRDDQAVDAHTTRAPAPIQPIRVEGPDLWSQMELVDTMIEQSLVSSTGGARNSECVDCVGGVSEAGWGGLRGVGGGCAARRSTSPLAAAPRGHASPCVKRDAKEAPAAWAAAGGGED